MTEESELTLWAHNLLLKIGVEPETAKLLDQFVIIVMILVAALLIDLVFRWIIQVIGRVLSKRIHKPWTELLFNPGVLRKFSDIVPVTLVYILIPLAYPVQSHTPLLWRKACVIYIIFVVIMFINMLLRVFFRILDGRDKLHVRPLKGLKQILQVSLFACGTVLVVSVLIGRTPMHLLTGLGASAAVLMLIFKDTILGFVSGVMLSANKMLKRGDWIEMPKYGVDGVVEDVTLNTVKVRNFDNTIVTVPPFVLTDDSFQNWQAMKESGGRRIMRALNINLNSVHFCTDEMMARYRTIGLVRTHVEHYMNELAAQQAAPYGADLSRITNLTFYRYYIEEYLAHSDLVRHDMRCMVRHLAPDENGLPLQVYCYVNKTEWIAYERIQADMFDHW